MRRIGRFLLITLVRGVVFLVPIVLIAVLASQGYQMIRRIFQPIARLFPSDRLLGMFVEDVVTILALALVFVIAGLFVGTSRGQLISNQLERGILYRLPGYLLVRGATWGYLGLDSEHPVAPVLVETEDSWALGLLVERHPEGYCTIFLPGSPTPTSGDVRIFEESRVRLLDTTMLGMISCLTRSGVGAGALAAQVLPPRKSGGPTEG